MEKSKNKKIKFLLVLIVTLFMIQALYLVYFTFFKRDKLNNHSLNARNYVDETKLHRGDILDINDKKLAWSELIDGEYKREYLYKYMYSSIIGYNSKQYGKTSIEASYNNELINLRNNKDIFSKLDNILENSNRGNDVRLTINDDIQSYVYDLLGNNKGTVIVSDPKTGKIISMVSKPGFDVKNIENNWEDIISSEDAVMINRATQGLYEPGSVFKIVSSMAILENDISLDYYDKGSATIRDHTINNYNKREYGEIDLEKALIHSSNTYFFEKSKEITNEEYLKVLNDFGIGKDYDFPLPKSKSKFPFKRGLSDLEKANAAFGQGETYMTPMDMLLVANAIANDGTVYTPYIVDSVIHSNRKEKTNPSILSDSLNKEDAIRIREYMKSAASYNGFTLNNYEMAGKTGTAETDSEKNHAWYIGMAPADDPKFVVVVLIEDTDLASHSISAPMAVKIMNYILDNGY